MGIEKVRFVPGITASNALDLYYMPYIHRLVGALVWSAGVGLIAVAWLRPSWRAPALVAAGAVFSYEGS
jgi:hypothetical protein